MQHGSPIDIGKLYEKAKDNLYKNKKIALDDPKPIRWVLPTGSMLLDRIIGVGGYPGGRIVELYGPESGGKSTIAMHACVEAQKMGVPFAYVDMEQSLDPAYFARIGIKGEPNKDGGWLHITPTTGEDAFAVAEHFLKEGIGLLVFDSVAAMVSKAELSGDYGEAQMGSQARMMSQGMRKITGLIAQQEAIAIFVNQVRNKIGIAYGNPEVTTGGVALKFYASVRISVRTADASQDLKDGENIIGKTARCKTVKNKVAPPLRECGIPIIWGRGIDKDSELFDLCIAEGIVNKTSSYFSYKDVKVNGRANFVKVLPEIRDELLEDIKRKWSVKEDNDEP